MIGASVPASVSICAASVNSARLPVPGVPKPVLWVVSPNPDVVSDECWVRDALDPGAFTYPVAEQWRTARVLFDAGVIDAPGGLRALIEAVHGEAGPEVPDALLAAEAEALGTSSASGRMGRRTSWHGKTATGRPGERRATRPIPPGSGRISGS